MIRLTPFLTNLAGLITVGVTFLGTVPSALATSGFYRADTNPTDFHTIINEFQQFANTEKEALSLKEIGARTLDATQLKLTYDQEVNIYFINEGANYRNQLGATSSGTTNFDQMVFSDITCIEKDCLFKGYRSPSNTFGTADGKPLEIGDYYNLGTIEAGSQLDFYLRKDGYGRSSTDVWYTDATNNSDGLQHLIAYEYKDYLVLAWEDIAGGGDLDYNDVVFVVDIGKENLENIPTATAAVPEPLTLIGVAVALGFGTLFKRKLAKQSNV